MTPQISYFQFWIHQNTLFVSSRKQVFFVFIYIEISEADNFDKNEKYVCRTILKIRVVNSRNSWIWDQYLKGNMNRKLGNFPLIELKHLHLIFFYNEGGRMQGWESKC